MSRISPKAPLGLKVPKAEKPKRKGLRRISKKRQKEHREDPEGLAYMLKVRQLPCIGCGAAPPNDAHHCKDKPPEGQDGPYQKSPHKHRRSGPRDTIPLCKFGCHNFGPNSYHVSPESWRERNGPDYGYILPTRAAVAAMDGEIDF